MKTEEKCDPGWDPGTLKEHQVKTKNLNKVWPLVNNNALILVH